MSVMVAAGLPGRLPPAHGVTGGMGIDMAEFAFDAVLNTAIRVEADTLERAVVYLRRQLDCFSPESGIELPTDGVTAARLTEISLGNHVLPDGRPAAALVLFEVDGVAAGDLVVMD